MSSVDRQVLPDPEALARRAAELVLAAALATQERFAIALSGGSTPRRLYQLLAAMPMPWQRTHWFWGDERFVPPGDPASNQRMVREALLAHVPVPPGQIHPIPTVGVTAQEAAAQYERTLHQFHGGAELRRDRPLFDIVLLGLGTNGHTASLFPGQPVLDERRHWTGTMHDPEAGTRITLTYSALESSRETLFLVAGADKKTVLSEVLAGDPRHPASHLKPVGTLRVLADAAAA
jgi:6-phosphogluconolactonase